MNSNDVIRIARIYAESRCLTMSTLGTYAAGDSRFFSRLTADRVTIRRAKRVLQWFSDNWPEGLEWPADIARPAPTLEREGREEGAVGAK